MNAVLQKIKHFHSFVIKPNKVWSMPTKSDFVIYDAYGSEIIKKMGSWYSYNDDKIGQGREKTKQYLQKNSDFTKKIDKEVKSFLGIE